MHFTWAGKIEQDPPRPADWTVLARFFFDFLKYLLNLCSSFIDLINVHGFRKRSGGASEPTAAREKQKEKKNENKNITFAKHN